MSDCYFLCKDHDTCFPNNSDESNIICSESIIEETKEIEDNKNIMISNKLTNEIKLY